MQGMFDSNVVTTPALTATATNGANGAEIMSDTGTALKGIGSRGVGVLGGSVNGIAVAAVCNGPGIGVRATSDSGTAVNAQSKSGIGIVAASDDNIGIQGTCQRGYNFGVVGVGANAGVAAFNPRNDHAAYLASDCCAAWFTGNVTVTGALFKGGGGFRIDHPLAPRDRFLSHSFVESSEMKNYYDGVAIADAAGEAVVTLPEWLEALNEQFRYQLTPLNGPAPELHIRSEINDNQFTIAGAKAGMKVCWSITGVRRDPWARTNPLVLEKEKEPKERGHYLHPALYGASEKDGLANVAHPRSELKPPAKE